MDNLKEEILSSEDNNEKKVGLNTSFASNLIDAIVMTIIALAVAFILDVVVLRLFGYMVVKEYKALFLFIVLIITTILYPTFMECRYGRTLGKKFSKTKIKIVEVDEEK